MLRDWSDRLVCFSEPYLAVANPKKGFGGTAKFVQAPS